MNRVDLRRLRGAGITAKVTTDDGKIEHLTIMPLPFKRFLELQETVEEKVVDENGRVDELATKKQQSDQMVSLIADTLQQTYTDTPRDELINMVKEFSMDNIQKITDAIFKVNGMEKEKVNPSQLSPN